MGSAPRISVVVRSYNRLGALVELLSALLAQDHDSFEVVVVEQSTVRPADELARVAALTRDPRVRVLRSEPLGGPGARNAGVRASRGELFVFIDDDDLPVGRDWLRRHEAALADPACLGVTGQFVEPDAPPYVSPDRARRAVLSFNALKWQRVFARTDVKKRVESLMGGNAAIPRRTLERFGLWDECTPIEDEPSLAFRIGAGKRPDEYLLFDPSIQMLRRLDVPGGMDKRTLSGPAYARRVFTFLHNIIGHYFPVRFALLYPAYIFLAGYHVTQWICSDSRRHRTLTSRVLAVAGTHLVFLPQWVACLAAWCVRRVRDGEPPHAPALAPARARAAVDQLPMTVPAIDRSGFAGPRSTAPATQRSTVQ
jgi:glycosyltransferase involved in cell wall biosynthesis